MRGSVSCMIQDVTPFSSNGPPQSDPKLRLRHTHVVMGLAFVGVRRSGSQYSSSYCKRRASGYLQKTDWSGSR